MYIDGIQYDITDSSMNISSEVSLVGKLHFVNVGTSIAEVRAHGILDSLTGNAAIRNIVREKEKRKKYMILYRDPSFFHRSIPPNDTTSFEVNLPLVNYGLDTITVLHFWILYENELGNLYDTYYWLTLHKLYARFDIDKKLYREGEVYQFNFVDTKAAEFGTENADYHIYGPDERDAVIKGLETRFRNVKNSQINQ
jgi:hypothetical protein